MPPKKNRNKNNTKKDLNVLINDLESYVVPGRRIKCDCQAAKHDLINNCTSCGRIVCAQEGAGNCMFCDEMVYTKEDKIKMLERGQYFGRKEKSKVAAMSHKDKLLDYDRSSEKRTRVIDDQADYFNTSTPWLSQEEKKKMEDKEKIYLDSKNRLLRKTVLKIDITGKRVLEEYENPNIYDANEDFSMQSTIQQASLGAKEDDENYSSFKLMEPEFVGTLEKSFKSLNINDNKNNGDLVQWTNRIQDAEIQEMVDSGNCLSVQQPWASLIINGIKRFEGRSWYTPVRGRLWIYSSSNKIPTKEAIEDAEKCYSLIYKNIEFPKNYPAGYLLGCCDLIDCLPQEEFQELYPNGEIADPYVFVLANPKLLNISLPIQVKGSKTKIFKLEKHILQAAKMSI